MTETQAVLISRAAAAPAPLMVPAPRCPVCVRVATPADVPFIDRLQKMHTHMVGWMPGKQIEGKIALGQVLIAEAPSPDRAGTNGGPGEGVSVGYCVSQDSYMGRDDVGIIYQLNVLPLKQRHLIGALLIRSVFERAAYGCRLFCCWCAQDIQANYFWEAIGFVPLAFRTGSASKQRIHIFWQRRIREADETTPYWFPSQTKSGALRQDRLVLPIPMGTHWRDAKPIVLPTNTVEPEMPKTLPGGAPVRPRPESAAPKVSNSQKLAIIRSQSSHLKGLPPGKAAVVTAGGIRYIERGDYEPQPEPTKLKRPPKPRAKNHPKLVAAARELRDRALEQINSGEWSLAQLGKYDVSRQLIAPPTAPDAALPQLPAAA
jgi:hypothetical protein